MKTGRIITSVGWRSFVDGLQMFLGNAPDGPSKSQRIALLLRNAWKLNQGDRVGGPGCP